VIWRSSQTKFPSSRQVEQERQEKNREPQPESGAAQDKQGVVNMHNQLKARSIEGLCSSNHSRQRGRSGFPSMTAFRCSISGIMRHLPNAKVSDGSQPLMTFDLSLSESAGSRSLDLLVRCP
jgi:hypothetical protein